MHAAAGSIARLDVLRTLMRVTAVVMPIMCEIAGSTFPQLSGRAQTVTWSEPVDRFAKFIEEASGRFAVPARWIRAVMQVESGGDEHAISSRGAMGLMQLMPGTWGELSIRYGLGLDPFDAHDNIIAGVAYLKDMHDRFGSAGFLAAYHAGPARYQQHLATGRPLPPETTAYVAAVTPLLADGQVERTAVPIRRALPWRAAPLFVERAGAP
jgi:soluble lytic murein transglycosylase-like protein